MEIITGTGGTEGANQSGVADHNARLVLTVLRHGGPLPGAELARRTGLSPQGISTILRRLEADGLVERGESLRGRVGKPRVPLSIAPEGALAFGLKVGRRGLELVVADLRGQVRARREVLHSYPLPGKTVSFVQGAVPELMEDVEAQGLDPARVCGLGVAMPFEIWEWTEHLGAPEEEFQAWRGLDVRSALEAVCPWAVSIRNDVTSAARAELALGPSRPERDWAYFFVGAFVGGGVVLDGRIRDGGRGNAGALGSLSVCGPAGTQQLIDAASLYLLGEDPWGPEGTPPGAQDAWLDRTAGALAQAALDACSVIDFEAVVIDGAMPAALRADLVQRTVAAMERLDRRGLLLPAVQEGTIGAPARALGAAMAPLEMRHFLY